MIHGPMMTAVKTGGLWWPMVAQVDGSSLEEAMQQIAKEYRVPAWGLNYCGLLRREMTTELLNLGFQATDLKVL